MKGKRRFPVYPFLLAIYPVVRLYAVNQDLVLPVLLLRSLAASLILAGIVLCASRIFLRDWQRSAIFASLCLAIFFFFQPICEFAPSWLRFRFVAGGLGAIVICTLLLLRRADELRVRQVGKVIAIFTAGLLIIPLITAIPKAVTGNLVGIGYKQWNASLDSERKSADHWKHVSAKDAPDIYYIILDMYARDDVLKKDFQYDNSRFLQELSSKGFYITHHSQSNYHKTLWSLASSLNMNYLPALGKAYVDDDALLVHKIKNNKVACVLKQMGYKYVFLRSGWHVTGLNYYADVNLYGGCGISEFERTLIQQTYLNRNMEDMMRYQVQGQFECLEHVSRGINGPKFVFAHIVCPHEPFLFDETGNKPSAPDNATPDKEKTALYLEQLQYLNKRIIKIVDSILAGSSKPPVIVIQADHGPYRSDYQTIWDSDKAPGLSDEYLQKVFADRVPIFSAYYLPGKKQQAIYDGISPVNSFRLIFNQYFGAHYKLLDDISYVPRSGQSASQQSAKRLRVY